jgi:hypothetical protein
MGRGQKTTAPQSIVKRLTTGTASAGGRHRNEGGKIFIFVPKTVRQPRSHAGTPGDLRAGLKERYCRVVVDRFGIHRLDETEFVGDRCKVRHQFADPCSTLAVLFEFED